jgi:ParB/RepB/Spo0J family partition protein
METGTNRFIEVELHCLVPRFAPLRLARAKALEALIRSIERDGQLTPVVAVAAPEHQWVLIDGYLRLEAVRRCGHDTIRVDVWPGDLPQALMAILAQTQRRPWQSIEEAHLLDELHTTFGYSQQDIARQIGRDASWVNRRLALVAALPSDLLEAVRQERVKTWAATRILAPLARANTDHAERLLAYIAQQPLSTRDLQTWFTHYQRANRITRARMVDNPRLFLDAVQAQHDTQQAQALQNGPEGGWLKDLRMITHILRRLRQQVATLFDPAQRLVDRRLLSTAFNDMMTEATGLQTDIKRSNANDSSRHPTSDFDSTSPTTADSRDQSADSGLAWHGAPGDSPARSDIAPAEGPG